MKMIFEFLCAVFVIVILGSLVFILAGAAILAAKGVFDALVREFYKYIS